MTWMLFGAFRVLSLIFVKLDMLEWHDIATWE